MAYKTKTVSSPLKLKKTSKFSSWWVKEEDEDEDENEPPLLVTRAIGGIFQQIVVKI